MEKNGIARDVAVRIYQQLAAFADYGFPESHAASFALLVYASAYVKHYFPAAFCAALLNAQPMGFYAPQTLVADARRHGVTVHPPCAARSEWGATLEDGAVRLGISSVRGVGEAPKATFVAARPFRSVGDFARRAGLSHASIERLAAAGGFACFGLARREALWQVAALPRGAPLPLAAPPAIDPVYLPPMAPREELAADFIGLGLSIDRHPVSLVRPALDAGGVRRAADVATRARHGERLAIAGMVITRQRPPTAKGMVFITLEDETGIANLILTPPVYDLRAPAPAGARRVPAHRPGEGGAAGAGREPARRGPAASGRRRGPRVQTEIISLSSEAPRTGAPSRPIRRRRRPPARRSARRRSASSPAPRSSPRRRSSRRSPRCPRCAGASRGARPARRPFPRRG
jgi:DNA polymerase III alpha subunit